VKLTNEFQVELPLDSVWPALADLPGVAACLPGADIEPVPGAGNDAVTGRLKVKLGPVSSEYTGTAQVAERDDDAHRMVIAVEARERGGGGATGRIRSQAFASDRGTRVTVESEIDVTGKQAQLGRGLMERVAGRMLTEFARQLEARLLAPGELASGSADSASSAPPGELDLGALALGWVGRHRVQLGLALAAVAAAGLVVFRRRRS
jgi:uncharacterized protein